MFQGGWLKLLTLDGVGPSCVEDIAWGAAGKLKKENPFGSGLVRPIGSLFVSLVRVVVVDAGKDRAHNTETHGEFRVLKLTFPSL